MKSKSTQTTPKNYIAGPDKLESFTNQFRSNLKEWLDEKNNPKLVVIDGEEKPLLSASITEVLKYAMEYTELWMPIPDEQKEDFKYKWFIDCRGLYIEYSVVNFLDEYSPLIKIIDDNRRNSRNFAPIKFDYSIIFGGSHLFFNKVFLGDASFYKVEFPIQIYFNETQFNGEVNFDDTIFSREAFFVNCNFKFKKGASFQGTKFLRCADFTKSHFNRVPIFHETKLPQGSSFTGAIFEKLGSDLKQHDIYQEIIALRTLRQIAAGYKGQQDEAIFFSLEQRYYRKVCLALRLEWAKKSYETRRQGQQGIKDLFIIDTWHWRTLKDLKYCFICWKPIEWFISLVYDYISEYGNNPTRAVYWLFGVNIIAGLFYNYMFDIGSDFYLSKDASTFAHNQPALHFVLQTLFNPSAIVSYKALVVVNNPYMFILAILQFLMTYIILILVALAIKTKFQKGGSA